MRFSLQDVKANIRNREGRRVFYLGTGDTMTSEARDYLAHERIEVLPAHQAKPRRWMLAGGGYCEDKPEHMTHLNGEMLVPKTHPRIAFRCAMDLLESELLLAMLPPGAPREALEEALELSRNILRYDVLEEPAPLVSLGGMDAETLRNHSHRPQDYYGTAHFMPSVVDGPVILWLNRCRCMARQAELAACRAFSREDGTVSREDIVILLNRLSSFLYILMIRQKAG